MSDDDDVLSRLTKRAQLPKSMFGRLRKTAGAMARTGISAARNGGLEASIFAAADPEAIEKLVMSMGELKGVAMKMGQILSYVDDSLPEETARILSLLQRHSASTPWEEVRAIIETDLGSNAEPLLAAMSQTPLASASVGQVHRARIQVHGEEVPVAVKVRHPGIDEAMRADFRATTPASMIAKLLAPGADVKAFVEEAREGFLAECDYDREARSQTRFQTLYADHPVLLIPEVHDAYCGARVLTTTFCDGESMEGFLAANPDQATRDTVGRALYEFYLGALYQHGLFNADPHPGNLLFRHDDSGVRVVVLDHGCVREFDEASVAQFVRLSRAVRRDDEAAVRSALVALGTKVPTDRSYGPTRDLLRGFFAPLLREGPHVIEARTPMATKSVIEAKTKMLKLHLPGKLLFLFRIRFGLYAVLQRLGARLDWAALEDELTASIC